ncbi:ABC transporter ATP-binding protein [Patescibacteria group bacterium]|nr:ABC transporter ATP-binding protein [Patescibacteria group bacterium]
MIEFQNISKIYNPGTPEAYTALHNISFAVKDEEFVAIMGPSGSGKSTLMHILGCLDTPTSGTYTLDNKDVSTMTDNELAEIRKDKIGFVFQSFNLLPRTTVLRNAMLPLVYAGIAPREREARAIDALHASGLTEEHFSHLSNQLSGGERQRVAIARALVNEPTLILADEPTGNLDSHTSLLVLETLQRLNREHGVTIVLITHESDIAGHAARIIRVRDGIILSDEKNETVRDAATETRLYDDLKRL